MCAKSLGKKRILMIMKNIMAYVRYSAIVCVDEREIDISITHVTLPSGSHAFASNKSSNRH